MREYSGKFKNDRNKQSADFPYWVLAVAILLTFALTYNFYQNAVNKDSLRFNNEVGRVQSQIENKINLYVALLKGGRGFIESSSGDLRRENFAKYVENLELEKNYAGVQGIGYTVVVSPDERGDFLNQLAAEGFGDAQTTSENAVDSFPIVRFYEPQNETNRRAVGFDMSSETNRRAALEAARDSGNAVTSAKVKLVEEDAGENAKTGFLIFLPIYKNGGTPAGLEQKRKNLSGYIYGSFRANDFLSEIQKSTTTYDIAIKMFDAENRAENLMAQTVLGESQNPAAFFENNYSSSDDANIAGRHWIFQYNALPSFTERSSVGWTALIFMSGIVFSLLLFGVTYWEVSARDALRKTAEELYELQGQKQVLLEKEQKARLSAEQANRAKDDFIAVVSHELRTPLNAIAGWTNILKTDNLSTGTKSLALGKIEKNLRSQTKLVEELLDYSQIISDVGDIAEKQINFSELFEEIYAEYETPAREKNIELTKENNLNGQVISGDKDKVKLLLENLFSNAVKFTDAGGTISTVVSQEAGDVRFSIKDNGKGISAEFLPHIFERFRQSENAMTRNFGGLGLGLAITNHIVKLHHGSIEATSGGKGKGSVFTVKFPLGAPHS